MMIRSLIAKKGNRKRYNWEVALPFIFGTDVISTFVLRRREHQEETEKYWAKQKKENEPKKNERFLMVLKSR